VGLQYTFGKVVVRPEERLLRVDGKDTPVGSRAFDVLIALIERRDRVVSKNELLDLAWPSGKAIEENNLTVQISVLRRLLGAPAIATVIGRGYRFTLSDEAAASRPAEPSGRERIERRLAAVAVADLVDWDAALAARPAAAIGAWQALRREALEPRVPAFGGRIVELTARGAQLEFASAVDALRWALDLQQRLEQQRQHPADVHLQMRVGIGIEDAIVDEGKLVGTAGALTAHLLKAAAPGQVVVDELLRTLVEHKIPVRFRALESAVPAMPGTRPVFAAEPVGDPAPPREAAAGWSTQGRPGVAVLPFDAGAGDEQRYFGDGMTEEIVASLSRNRSLFVIARSSTLRYRGSDRTPAEIATELGVDYVMSGTVRRSHGHLHLGAELVEARKENVVWAETFDGQDEDLFDFQGRIAANIAAAVDPAVQEAEIARVAERPTGHLGAYDCMLRGLAVLHTFRDEDIDLAGRHFRHAIDLDPGYARAHAHLAWWHNLRIGEGWTADKHEDERLAEHHSQRAIELDPRDALALSVAGHIQSFVRKRPLAAMDLFNRALTINPSSSIAWARSATTLAYLGRGEEAIERVATAIRLSPYDPQSYAFFTTNGSACMVAGRPAEAVGWLARARRLNPRYRAAHRLHMAALVMSGELDEAHDAARDFLRVDPGFRVGTFGGWYPLCEPHLGRLLDALRRAGLPD